MKKLLFIVIVLLLVFPSVVYAQEGPPEDLRETSTCTKGDVFKWLYARKGAMNAANDVTRGVFGNKLPGAVGSMLMMELHFYLLHLDRPACADGAMLWTSYLFTVLAESMLAYGEDNGEVLNTCINRLRIYQESGVPLVIHPLSIWAEIDLKHDFYSEVRPPGWVLTPEGEMKEEFIPQTEPKPAPTQSS